MSRWAERVLFLGLGALLVQGAVVVTDVLLRRGDNPFGYQPPRPAHAHQPVKGA